MTTRHLLLSQIQNYFVAAGMNSSGIAAAGGVGKYMAEWIIEGQPSIDLWSLDIRRFIDMHNNKKFLKDRVTEVLGNLLSASFLSFILLPPFQLLSEKLLFSHFHCGLFVLAVKRKKNARRQKAFEFTNIMSQQSFSAVSGTATCPWDWKHVAFKKGRKLRTSPLYTRVESDAVCGQFKGYERPLYFLSSTKESGQFGSDLYCMISFISMTFVQS